METDGPRYPHDCPHCVFTHRLGILDVYDCRDSIVAGFAYRWGPGDKSTTMPEYAMKIQADYDRHSDISLGIKPFLTQIDDGTFDRLHKLFSKHAPITDSTSMISDYINAFGPAKVLRVATTFDCIFFGVRTNDRTLISLWRGIILAQLRDLEFYWKPLGAKVVYALWPDRDDRDAAAGVAPLITRINTDLERRAKAEPSFA